MGGGWPDFVARLSNINICTLYLSRWTRQDQCVGSCPANSGCESGVCVCGQEEGWTQVHGRCEWNTTAVFLGDDHKYRKPKPPPKPRECLCKKRNSNFVIDSHPTVGGVFMWSLFKVMLVFFYGK